MKERCCGNTDNNDADYDNSNARNNSSARNNSNGGSSEPTEVRSDAVLGCRGGTIWWPNGWPRVTSSQSGPPNYPPVQTQLSRDQFAR